MSNEAVLLECWRELPLEAQERVLKFAQSLRLQTSTEFVPQTRLGKKLWEIRQQAITQGMQLLSEEELEQELAERRGGYVEP